jgi:hypothetical protein
MNIFSPRRFYLEWIAATAIGTAIGWALFTPAYASMIGLFGGANEGEAFRALTAAMAWAVVYVLSAVAQWVVVRRMLIWSFVWIPAGALGGVAFGITSEVIFGAQGGTMSGALGGAAAGIVSGIAQWPLLRRMGNQALWWAPVSAGAAAVAGALGWSVIEPVLRSIGAAGGPAAAWAISGALGGAAGGMISGATLVWLIRRRFERCA